LPISAVIPRPIAAGVLGIARTIGVAAPRTCAKVAMDVPAAIETNRVSPLPKAASDGKASPIICGLTATITIAVDLDPLIFHPIRRRGVNHPNGTRRQTTCQPPRQHRRAHLSTPEQHKPAVCHHMSDQIQDLRQNLDILFCKFELIQ